MKKRIGNKTIVIFSAYIPPHLGGIERYIDNLSRKLVEKGIKVVIVTSNLNNGVSRENVNGIEILRLPIYNVFKNRYPIIKKNKKYREVMSNLDKYDIDTIIVNTRFHLTSHVGAKYGKKRGVPVYLIEHGSNYVTLNNKFIDFFANRYEDFLTNRIRKKIKAFYGVSDACGQWLKHFGIDASGTWYNSIDIDQKLPIRKKHEGINFMYAGRIIKQKGVENILNSFIKLEDKFKDIKLYIAGDGPELGEYKKEFSNNNTIKFLGKLDYNTLLEYYAKTDVFLYPPLWPEGLPTSILEAGLMKCAVIGTRQGGICEVIINRKNGILVDNDMNSLYLAMKELLSDKNLIKNYSNEINKTINEKFSWDSTANKILGDIDER